MHEDNIAQSGINRNNYAENTQKFALHMRVFGRCGSSFLINERRFNQQAFFDPHRVIVEDAKHSDDEAQLFCIGMVEGLVVTIRYTVREDRIRIIGAGYWRAGKRLYYGEEL